MAAAVYGGSAVVLRQKWLYILAGLAILITAFSRNYLGVHTPQDVICGFLLAVFSLYITAKALKYIEQHRNQEDFILAVLFCLGIATLVYAEYKPYPMDYTAEGKLLVDPIAMMNDTFHGIGMMLGLIIGRYLEREYVKFEATGLGVKGIILAVLGFIPYYFIVFNFVKTYTFLMNPLAEMLTKRWAYMVIGFITSFWSVFLWPCVIRLTQKGK